MEADNSKPSSSSPEAPMDALLPLCLEALSSNNLVLVRAAVDSGLPFDSLLQWRPDATRTLAQLAAQFGSIECLAWLLQLGADPNAAAPEDGFTALHCACAGGSPRTAEAVALLLTHNAQRDAVDHVGRRPVDLLLPATEGMVMNADADFSELGDPEYGTDEFRMYSFKVLNCPKPCAHDWTECPFAHPGEKACRRNPREYSYSGTACPDFRKGMCKRGDVCEYAHGVFECWLHPSRYRTQLCKDAPGCLRRVCFFAHSLDELRQPTDTFEPAPLRPRGPSSAASSGQSNSSGSSRDSSPASTNSRRSSPGRSSPEPVAAALPQQQQPQKARVRAAGLERQLPAARPLQGAAAAPGSPLGPELGFLTGLSSALSHLSLAGGPGGLPQHSSPTMLLPQQQQHATAGLPAPLLSAAFGGHHHHHLALNGPFPRLDSRQQQHLLAAAGSPSMFLQHQHQPSSHLLDGGALAPPPSGLQHPAMAFTDRPLQPARADLEQLGHVRFPSPGVPARRPSPRPLQLQQPQHSPLGLGFAPHPVQSAPFAAPALQAQHHQQQQPPSHHHSHSWVSRLAAQEMAALGMYSDFALQGIHATYNCQGAMQGAHAVNVQ